MFTPRRQPSSSPGRGAWVEGRGLSIERDGRDGRCESRTARQRHAHSSTPRRSQTMTTFVASPLDGAASPVTTYRVRFGIFYNVE